MRNRLPWFLLAASLALNLFFLAGFAYPWLMGFPPHPRHYDPVAEARREFSLDDKQVQALQALRTNIAERRDQSRGQRDSFRTLILDALKAPTFDRAALKQALAQRRDASGDMLVDMVGDLHSFVAQLNPQQKEEFLKRAEEHDFLRRLLFPPPRFRNHDDRPPPR